VSYDLYRENLAGRVGGVFNPVGYRQPELSAVGRLVNKTRKELLRNMPEMITREEVRQLVTAPPDIWRYIRFGSRLLAGLIAYFILWVTVAFFTDAVTPWIVCTMAAAWLAPKYMRDK
jgi:hypothetical protein